MVKRDLIGQRFGHLTVVNKTDERQDGYFLWCCQCDCGKEVLVNTKRLVRGTMTSCGCVPKTTARNGRCAEDLTGRVFGELTALYRAPNQNGRTYWFCRCSCGNEVILSARQLKSGQAKDCGCKSPKLKNGLNIHSRRFGRLVALYPTERRDKRGSIYWHCRCDCGNEVEVTENGLVHGSYRSCGCLKREIQQNIPSHLHMVDGTCVEWLAHRKHRSDNTSGFRGVYRLKNGKYRVTIGFKQRRYYIGSYWDFNEAVSARLEAEKLIHDGFLKAYDTWKNKDNLADKRPLIFDVEKVDGQFVVRTG